MRTRTHTHSLTHTCTHLQDTAMMQERVALQKGFVDYVIGPYYKLVAGARD